MLRLLLVAIPALFGVGCGTEGRLLDPVHTPLVQVSSDRPADGLDSAVPRAVVQASRWQRAFEPWP